MGGLANLETRILYDQYGRWLWFMRTMPWHAAFYLSGIVLPSHERYWLRVYFGETKENNVVASRGTSKSFTHASLAAPLKTLLFKNVNTLTLSASGFRGGKELFKDAARLVEGQLKSQDLPGAFMLAAVKSPKVIAKDPSKWDMIFRSGGTYSTAPTNNPDQLRGLRANEVQVDERNTFPGEVVQKIIRPMLNVGQDFKRAASGGDRNKIYQISTIDFTVRDWYPELQVAESLQKREYDAWKARKAGDWDEYDRLMGENEGQLRTASFSYTRVDYTDLLIPEVVATMDGERRYRVNFPMEPGVQREDILRYDEQDGQSFWYTYPVDKKGLEEPLRSGTVDPEIWLAEQRNTFIASSGNVFDYELIQRISERPVWQAKDAPKSRRRKVDDEDDDRSKEEYYAPILHSCGDPCVLGIDVARESDETAFVVFRLGELAEGDFDPLLPQVDAKGRPVLGKTTWNHICWAESWKQLQADRAAEIARDLYERYNIIATLDVGGMAMDKRGGGSAVRDSLGNPKPLVEDGVVDPNWSWDKTLKMYDPEDLDGGFGHYSAEKPNDPMYWGGLRLIASTNQDNVDWTYGTRALMQQKKLYLGFWQPPSRWAFEKGLLTAGGEADKLNPEYQKWLVGYNGIRRLKTQLLRLQTKVSEQGTIRFVMPGERTKEEGKKDLWAAMIYGFSLVRQYRLSLTKEEAPAPMVAPVIVTMNPAQRLQGMFNTGTPSGVFGRGR